MQKAPDLNLRKVEFYLLNSCIYIISSEWDKSEWVRPLVRPNFGQTHLEYQLDVVKEEDAAVAGVGLLGNGRMLLGHLLLAEVQGQRFLLHVLKLEVGSGI